MDTVNIKVNGQPVECKQFVGIGTLNVQTTRGEVKAHSSDYICTFLASGVTVVLPESTVHALVEGDSDRELSENEKVDFFKDLGDGSGTEDAPPSAEVVPPTPPAVDPMLSLLNPK